MTAQPRLLGGRYEIGPMIGYGGMAEVHRGTDLRLGRDVAIKMLRTDLARDETFLTRFRREAQNAASLNHPSIVAVYDTGEDTTGATPVPYIVMEYVEGRTLKEVLIAEGRLSPRRACEIVADVCTALDFSHRHQIIHRDVKPGNVMLSSNGQVKVMDFGIARAMASGQATMTQTSAVIGTAQYLSPEQARGETVDARSDVYATGCLLYELLVGNPPFTGDNPVSVAYQHVREAPIPPSQVDPDVPPSVDAIVLQALAKSPANRYQTAGEMSDDLERAIAGRPVLATQAPIDDGTTQLLGAADADATRVVPAAVDEPYRPKRTGRKVAAVLIALVVLAGIGLGVWYFTKGEAQVPVPSVVGMRQQEAVDTLSQKGLKSKVEKVKSSDANLGKVTKQTPGKNTKVDKNSTVILSVGRGAGKVEVPTLEGYVGCDDMRTAVEKAGLKFKCDKKDSEEKEGTWMDQKPDAGSKVKPNTTVTVTVSNGNLKNATDVVGLDEDTACQRIKEDGFECSVTYVDPGGDDPGQVEEQSPTKDETAEPGSTIDIKVGGVQVPDLKDMTIGDAKSEYGSDFSIVTDNPDADDTWVITGQTPGKGGWKKPGTTIRVTAKRGGIGG
ncbi:MAG TPA: Stk1 family PASTA domain-containing Ser/Thr kinase [Stackebrandtia sp.]|jgi:serine/threonine-protein kinase|uniref:Stk1 family PASTA domain-containing Ser/Thr kinase n=1 Tax=Stackebrandtia sp. TaxID=2023065 RepID=UPI002D4FAC44|nr:Stk1 family PASTA domain-containing Ser/Thr kinase [Stackebrandtia sp.]HZE37803.1 Stk1 family PASTA domain-containing Ser/Thr kinase [Stackebrandtia sp.]